MNAKKQKQTKIIGHGLQLPNILRLLPKTSSS